MDLAEYIYYTLLNLNKFGVFSSILSFILAKSGNVFTHSANEIKAKLYMNDLLIGRKEEQRILQKALESREAEMVAVMGRRRVGKTFLVKSVYQERIVFEVTGIQNFIRNRLPSLNLMQMPYATKRASSGKRQKPGNI